MTWQAFVRARIAVAMVSLLAIPAQIAGQTGSVLKFTNGQERAVVSNVSKDITAIDDIQEREFEGTVMSIGRANTLAATLLDKLKTKDRKLYDEVRKITTSVEVAQGSNRFYVRGLNSTNLAGFRTGKPKVRCRVYLLEIRSGDEVSYLPIVAAIRKAGEPQPSDTRRQAEVRK